MTKRRCISRTNVLHVVQLCCSTGWGSMVLCPFLRWWWWGTYCRCCNTLVCKAKVAVYLPFVQLMVITVYPTSPAVSDSFLSFFPLFLRLFCLFPVRSVFFSNFFIFLLLTFVIPSLQPIFPSFLLPFFSCGVYSSFLSMPSFALLPSFPTFFSSFLPSYFYSHLSIPPSP